MLTMDNFNHISIYKGDKDSLAFVIDKYYLIDDVDKVEMVVKNKQTPTIYFKVIVSKFKNGLAILNFDEYKLGKMPVGEYKYQIRVKLPKLNYESLHMEGDFTIKENLF